jgi:hypothetical protein
MLVTAACAERTGRLRANGGAVPGEPVLLVIPASDWQLAARAHEILGAGVRSPSELEARLRDLHPSLIVRRRDLSGESSELWYVYREGHWVPPDPNAGLRDQVGGISVRD